MTFEYPKIDKRKKERITIRLDFLTLFKIKEISKHEKKDVSKIIRDLINKLV